MSAKAEFLDFVSEASGTHALALAALQSQRRLHKSLPMLPDDRDPIIGWSVGDPNVPGEIVSRPGWPLSRYLANTEYGGMCERYLGWSWIILVYDRWEDDFRSRFAREISCTHDDVLSDLMNDLHLIRNDISHNKGYATSEKSGRCSILLDWFTVGNYIVIDISQTGRFYDLATADDFTYVRKSS